MSSLTFGPEGALHASGTRGAFGALSDDLVAEGHPAMRSNFGDRELADEIRIFTSRYRQQASGSGPFGDVREWDGSAHGFPGGRRWVRISAQGTVAPPGSSNHGKRRSSDLAYPYDRDTAAHRRAQVLAKRHGITCEGMGFREWWHWTFWGALGDIDAASPASGKATPFDPARILEDTMSTNPIVNVIDRYDPTNPDAWKNGRVMIGLDDGSFEPLPEPFPNNVRGIIGAVFLGTGDGGKQDAIPTVSVDDFNVTRAVWAQMCKGRTDAAAVWAEGIHAQNADGQPLFVDKAGRISTDPSGEPLKFNAAGFIASTNALAHDAAE